MCECEKINTCGTIHLATCVKYEGFIPEDSDLKKECDVTVEEAIEDLYKREKSGSINIEAGDFLELNSSTLNVLVGNTETTVKRGDWLPTWEDVTNKPIISDVNVGEGLVKNEDTISISPNVVSDINKGVQSFSWGDHRSEGYLKQIPLATNTEIGGFKLVSNQVQNVLQNSVSNVNNRTYSIQLNSLGQGVVNVPWESSSYSAGTGITINDNTISQTLTVEGVGSFVKSVSQVSGGIKVIMDTPAGANYLAGTGISITGQTIINSSPNIIQTLSLTGQTLNLSNGGGSVIIPDYNLPEATFTTLGGVKLGSTATNNTVINEITTVNSRTYAVQKNTQGQLVVNVPWTDSSSFSAGSGISIDGNVITNISPNATHTGDVTGTVALSIASGVVSNTKLSPMPALTIKGKIGNSGQPQDLTVQQVKDMLGLVETNNRVVFAVGVYNLDLQLYNTTTVFAKMDEEGISTVVIPEGDFEGQTINFYVDSTKADTYFLEGDFIISSEPEYLTTNFDYSRYNFEHLYWSSNRQKWVVGNIYKA